MKKMMKRSLALGALMAFVITGSAMAESTKIFDRDGGIHNYSENVNITSHVVTTKKDGKEVGVIGAYVDKSTVANIDGSSVRLNLEHDLTVYGFRTNSKGLINFGKNNVVDSVDMIVKSNNGYSYGIVAMDKGSKISINTKVFNIEVIDHQTGHPSSFAVLAQGGNDFPEGLGEMAPTIKINAENINITSTGNGIGAFSNGQVDINGNLVVNALHAIDTRGNSTINVNTDGKHTTVLNGDIVFETPATPENSHSSGSIINSYVNVNLNGEDSSWTGRAYQYYTNNGKPIESVELIAEPFYGNVTGFKLDIANGASWNVTGDSFANTVNLKEGGSVNIGDKVSEMNVTEVNMTGGTINMNGQAQTMSVNNLVGDDGTINVSNSENKVSIVEKNEVKSLTVGATTEYSKELAKGDIAEGLQQIADQVVDNTTGTGKSAADNVTMAETGVLGETSVQVGDDGKIIVDTIKEDVNSSNAGIAQMGSVALMTWRQENNDMNKRLGELRNSKGEHGIWTRMTRGESDFEGIKNQYNSYQIGYDEKLSNDKTWTVGAALTYTEGKSSFAEGSGENTHKGFAVYGSKLNEDGSFIDLIAKYARLDHEFDAIGGAGSGEYDTNGYSVSAEYGKRFEKGNGFWVEPQVELTYGKIGSASYKTSEGVTVAQDGMDSLVGRVGFSLGKDIKDGNVYVRASYLYDFDGETSMSFSDGQYTRTMEQDLGGGWFEVGVGTNINMSDATYVYLDVEKTYGGDVATPWQWNAGVRYSF